MHHKLDLMHAYEFQLKKDQYSVHDFALHLGKQRRHPIRTHLDIMQFVEDLCMAIL